MEQCVGEKKLFYNHTSDPLPGSLKEQQIFAEIQNNFSKQFEQYFPDKQAAKTIVILPSLTLDQHDKNSFCNEHSH